MDPKATKFALREAIKDRLMRMSDKDLAAESRSIARRIIEKLPPEPVAICAYVPLKIEADITPVLTHLLEHNYPLFLPRFEGGKMVFREAQNLASLIVGQFNIPEPPLSMPELNPETLAIALVPARAYAPDGRRLGRGNGGYDIWIRAQRNMNPRTQFWGVCYEAQLVNDIPMEPHDEHVDAVITARGKMDIRIDH